MATVISMDEAAFLGAARVTCAFLLLLSCCLIWQGVTRTSHYFQAMKRKERYDRTKDTSLYPIDRTVGNLLEWSPIFLGFFWVSMIISNGATLTAGWLYVAARALYPIMAVNKGIGTVGAKTPILVATVPAYIALIMMTTPAFKALFL